MPNTPTRILIIAAPFGTGHTQAALNLREALWEIRPQAEIEIINSTTDQKSLGTTFVNYLYLQSIQHTPRLYESGFRYFDCPARWHCLQKVFTPFTQKQLAKKIKSYAPHIVLVTHPFPISALSLIRKNFNLPFQLGAIVTDFTVHAAWIHSQVDLYFVATPESRQHLINSGIPHRQIEVTGIPIARKYSQKIEKQQARQDLGLSIEQPMVLVMGGGLGMGAMTDLLLQINQVKIPLQTVFITGNNLALQKQLTALAQASPHQIRVTGYTEAVHTLMAGADLLITKPGGLTCSEAIAADLPFLIVEPIPGHEQDNAAYLEQKGVTLCVQNPVQILKSLNSLTEYSPATFTPIPEAVQQLRKPEAARKIANIVLNRLGPQ